MLDVEETDLLVVLPQCLEWIQAGRAAGQFDTRSTVRNTI